VAGLIPRLPAVPDAATLARHLPAIAPVPPGTPRPFWSVMVPTYNDAHYLRLALASVLEQDPGPETMQIEVIDDGSVTGDAEAVVREAGRGRVAFHRNAKNLGATATFNECLRRARGRWIHLLHADDLVRSGFYAAYRDVIGTRDDLAMVIGEVQVIDEAGNPGDRMGPDPPAQGHVLEDFACRQAVGHLGQFAGWVMRRDAVERVGGFSTLFRHCADWDLAFRIGLAGPVGCVSRPWSCYRAHAASDTSRLMVSGTNTYERALVTRLCLSRLDREACGLARRTWRPRLARTALRAAWTLDAAGSTEGRLNQARWAFALRPTPRHALFLLRSWLKHARASGR
jgi:GT2 family glycosyltransferase